MGGRGRSRGGLDRPAFDSGGREAAAARHGKNCPKNRRIGHLRLPSGGRRHLARFSIFAKNCICPGRPTPRAISFRNSSEMTSELTDGLGSII